MHSTDDDSGNWFGPRLLFSLLLVVAISFVSGAVAYSLASLFLG